MRLVLFIAIAFFFDLYAFEAFKTISLSWSGEAQQVLFYTYWTFSIFFLGFMLGSSFGDLKERIGENRYNNIRGFITILYISKFLIVVILLSDDLRRGLLNLAQPNPVGYPRSLFLAYLGLLLGSIPFILLNYGMLRNRYRYKVRKISIPINNLPEALGGLKIVQISDIHAGSLTATAKVKKAVELVNSLNADLVFFTGDLVNHRASEMQPLIGIFSQLKAKYGIYSILGNHDYGDYVRWPSTEAKAQNLEKVKAIHHEMGWNLLLNTNEIVTINKAPLAIIGVENYAGTPRFSQYGDLRKAYIGTEEIPTKLLLSHDPSHWKAQVTSDFSDIAITFSGHTHGFQFGIDTSWFKWSPVQYVYKEWIGLYKENSQYLYVNRGLGFHGYPGRVGVLAEISLIELESIKKA